MPAKKKVEEVKEPSVATPVKEEKKVEEKTTDMVQIPRADFDSLMDRMEKQTKDIDLLYKSADKSRLAKAKINSGEELVSQVRVSTWDDTGKIIISSKMVVNRSEIINGRHVEQQDCVLVLEGGETVEVSYLESIRRSKIQITGDIIGRTTKTDSLGNEFEIFELQLENGKKISINSEFIN
jgi:hypothetical protein